MQKGVRVCKVSDENSSFYGEASKTGKNIMDLSVCEWVIVALCAMIIGVDKAGFPGCGILAIAVMASTFPARSSVGILLGILILADMFAVLYYRRNAQWSHLLHLFPAAFAGIVAGYFGLRFVNNEQLRPIIGVMILIMVAINYWRVRIEKDNTAVPSQWWFTVPIGFLAGIATIMANAAGPLMIIYLTAMRLGKVEFVGTAAVFFFIVNWIKVPFNVNLGLITAESVKLNLLMLPFIIIGAVGGIFFLKRIPLKGFRVVVQILVICGAIKLLF